MMSYLQHAASQVSQEDGKLARGMSSAPPPNIHQIMWIHTHALRLSFHPPKSNVPEGLQLSHCHE